MSGEVSDDNWEALYATAVRQSLLGVTSRGIERLSPDMKPPLEIMMRWMGEAERIRTWNQLLNKEAARQTQLFGAEHLSTAILKGQANARLYPDSLARQPGDIDIYVSGGRKKVLGLDHCKEALSQGQATVSYHHLHMPPTEQGIDVEIHFRPSSGNMNPISNFFIQRWLSREIATTTLVPEGFYVPSISFALVMQLSHIQRHFLAGGIGLRQICDYYYLLQNATPTDLSRVRNVLSRTGLRHSAGAVVWILQHVLCLDEAHSLCPPDERRGRQMLGDIMDGGNFGQYSEHRKRALWAAFFHQRLHAIHLLRFDFSEVAWIELRHYWHLFTTLPTRIRHRSLSLRYIKR